MTGQVPPGLVEQLRAAGCVFAEDEARVLARGHRRAGRARARSSRGGWRANRSSRSSAGPSSVAAGSSSSRACSCPGGAASGWSSTALSADGRACAPSWCWTCAAAAARSASPSPRTAADVELHAAELDPAAVRCLRRNLRARGAAARQRATCSTRCRPTLRGRVDMLLANAPYVPHGRAGLPAGRGPRPRARRAPWTAAPTGSTCTAASPLPRRTGWRPVACCSSRPADASATPPCSCCRPRPAGPDVPRRGPGRHRGRRNQNRTAENVAPESWLRYSALSSSTTTACVGVVKPRSAH